MIHLTTPFLARSLATAAVSAAAASFFVWMDCNPSLYCYDKFLGDTRRRSFVENKCFWIIGASSGIGEELAYQIASSCGPTSDSNSVRLILSSRSVDKLQRVAQNCQKRNPNCQVHVVPVDVTDTSSLESAVVSVASQTPIDVVVLNAGRGQLAPALETDAETIQQIVQQTAVWPMILTPLLFRYDIFRPTTFGQRPHLVVTSSTASLVPLPLSASYAASKHAINAYFRSLQAEINGKDSSAIRVDLVCPGPVDTDFHSNSNGALNKYQATNEVVRAGDNQGRLSSHRTKKQMKMSVGRCAQLMLTTMGWYSRGGRETWISPQPSLAFLYLHYLMPEWMSRSIIQAFGTKRLALWRKGLDLYDPESWRTNLYGKETKPVNGQDSSSQS